jgi:hypothetical protein
VVTLVTQVSFWRLKLHARRGVALDFEARLVNFEQSAGPLALNTDKRQIPLWTPTPSQSRECLNSRVAFKAPAFAPDDRENGRL